MDIPNILWIVFFFQIVMILYKREENRFWPQECFLSWFSPWHSLISPTSTLCSLQYHFSCRFSPITSPEIVYYALTFVASCLLSVFDFPLLSSITSSCHFQSFSPLYIYPSPPGGISCSLSLSCPLSLYRNSPHSSLVSALVFVFPTTSEWVYISKHLCVSQTQG